MIVRRLNIEDIPQLREIHDKYFTEEFEFPNFEKFHETILVENVNGSIISAGGIRPIAESVIITNLGLSVGTRLEALSQVMATQIMDCNRFGYDALHAFVQNQIWKEQLLKAGFTRTKGDPVVLVLR